MKREEDLISILLKETYGQISQQSSGEEVSLSEYFQKKQSASEGLVVCKLCFYSQFARIDFGSEFLDIPYGLGLIEKEAFESRVGFRPVPISDFTWMKILTERFSKRISWMAYSHDEAKVFFLTREEAEELNEDINNEVKIAA
jgi:hypothetical protein